MNLEQFANELAALIAENKNLKARNKWQRQTALRLFFRRLDIAPVVLDFVEYDNDGVSLSIEHDGTATCYVLWGISVYAYSAEQYDEFCAKCSEILKGLP